MAETVITGFQLKPGDQLLWNGEYLRVGRTERIHNSTANLYVVFAGVNKTVVIDPYASLKVLR
jgi:hypothetical protein